MNRTTFRRIGQASLILMIPYIIHASPHLAGLFFIGVVTGIMWCMFALDYRGVWFRKDDQAKPQKFSETDLPVMKIIGTELQNRVKPHALYTWDLVLRPVLMPDGARLFNIRFDFVPSADGSFVLDPEFPAVPLKRGVPLTLSLRAGLRGENVCIAELQVNRKRPLSGPANRKISPLNLKNSDPALKFIVDGIAPSVPADCTWGIAFLEYVRTKTPHLHSGLEIVSAKDAAFRFAGSEFSLKAGKPLQLEFDVDAVLTFLSHPRKAGWMKRLLCFRN